MKNDPNQLTFQECYALAMPLLSSFVHSSDVVYLAVLNSTGHIQDCNLALSECLKVSCSDLVGKDFTTFLTTPDGKSFTNRLATSDVSPEEELLINVVDSEQIPHTIRFRMAVVPGGFLLLGEPPKNDNDALQEELLQLNNQLSVLSRENIRKGRILAKTLEELKKTQALLVHQEKMASLGVMTAGIAHEINNPLAFVLSNEQILKRDFADLSSYIHTMTNVLPEIAKISPDLHSELREKASEVELEYLIEALPRKIKANIEGLERVKQIILDLRNFSRLDEAEQMDCYLEESIHSTLRFLGPLLKTQNVSIETDLAELPQLLCSPGPLNQAISNVLSNAIQASKPGQVVRVTTRKMDGFQCIEIEDKGSGISAEHLSKVFDPFFTTKPVGSGTGLGLSISQQIVTSQHGRIEIASVPGSGTTVKILLPSNPQPQS